MTRGATTIPANGTPLTVFDCADAASGCHKQRAANAVVAAAVADGAVRVAVGSCGSYGMALALAARSVGIAVTVALPAAAASRRGHIVAAGAQARVIDGSYEDAVAASRLYATAEGVVDGNVDGPYAACAERALASIAGELVRVLGVAPAVVWAPIGNGTTVMALARAFARADVATRVVGVTAAGQNSVLASWPGVKHAPMRRDAVRSTPVRDPLVNWSALHGQEALVALRAVDGAVVGVDDAELLAARELLGRYGLRASPAGAAGVAGAIACADRQRRDGVHAAIVTGR